MARHNPSIDHYKYHYLFLKGHFTTKKDVLKYTSRITILLSKLIIKAGARPRQQQSPSQLQPKYRNFLSIAGSNGSGGNRMDSYQEEDRKAADDGTVLPFMI